ncbi:unnamed protein product [Musa acuminata subsp. malaccensis]|uniref:(wild Malaysian banana) hypothetical protein n=1 Tax=Musa acuminata subsp. malaccensis TaxID=214687 RepID=A0A804JU93_MUSAM|nr:unnamed protein product [Musa acuminata subsp. malaccensis]
MVAPNGEPLTVQAPGTRPEVSVMFLTWLMGLIRLMEGDNTGPINLGNPGEFTMMERAEIVKEVILIKMIENARDDPRQRKPDITKAKYLLGWNLKIILR